MAKMLVEAQIADVADAYVNSPKHLSMLSAAFHRATDIPPEETVLVQQELANGGEGCYFVRLVSIDDNGCLQLETVRHRGWLRRSLRRLLEALW